MAKKTVAKLKKKGGAGYVKVIRAVKSSKSGAYTFKEDIIVSDNLKDFLKENK